MAPTSVSADSRGTTPAYVRGSTPAVRASPAPEAKPSGPGSPKLTTSSKRDDNSSEKRDDIPPASDKKDATSAPDTKPRVDEGKPERAASETTSESSPAKAAAVVSTAPKKSSEPPIDMETFSQILEMDDDDDCEFSRSIVENYFEQAVSTFDSMDEALEKKNLKKLSELGHFLKGSSAALGVWRVQATCESLQHYGLLKDYDHVLDQPVSSISEGRSRTKSGVPKELTPDDALQKSQVLVVRVRDEYAEAEAWLKKELKLT